MTCQHAAEFIEAIAAGLERWQQRKVVLDPVMIAASGDNGLPPSSCGPPKLASQTKGAVQTFSCKQQGEKQRKGLGPNRRRATRAKSRARSIASDTGFPCFYACCLQGLQPRAWRAGLTSRPPLPVGGARIPRASARSCSGRSPAQDSRPRPA